MMGLKNRFVSAGCALVAALACVPGVALALEVYQWTDENGVVHFSQWAPGEGVEDVETVSVEGGGQRDHGIGVSEADDPDGYQAHRAEMDALWADIEERREAERRQQERAPSREIVYYPEPDYGYPILFPGHRFRPPFRPDPPPHRPRPPGEMEPPETPPVRPLPYKRP